MNRYVAECFGTFVLVFAGCGSAVLAGPQLGPLGVALAFGLALLAMVYAVGRISGCHLNPAVTLGLLVTGKASARDAGWYVVAQIAGSVAAAALILVVAGGAAAGDSLGIEGLAANGYGAHSPGGYGVLSAFLVETVLTAILVFTVLGVTDVAAPVGFAGLAIGLVLTVAHLVGIPVTNTSVNPARSLGPAVFVGGWALQQLWLFVSAPLLGALIAAGCYSVIRVSTGRELTARQAHEALPTEQAARKPRVA